MVQCFYCNAACIVLRVVGAVRVWIVFLRRWRKIQSSSIWEANEMSQTLLTNKTQGNLD